MSAQSGIGAILYAVGATDTGRIREQNEDAYVIADLSKTGARGPRFEVGARGVLLAVSDGMGGAEAGEVASALVVESLREHLDEGCKATDMLDSVRCAVELANLDVMAASNEAGRRGMGATLVAVVVHRSLAHIASVGDSRAYLIREGRIRRVTKDQSYVELLVDAGVMTREQAESSEHRHLILQSLGKRSSVKVALGRLEMRRGDVFVICSDGLSGKVADAEIFAIVRQASTHEEACARLIALANERGGEDNITIILAEVAGLDLKKPAPTEGVTETLQNVQRFDPTQA